MTTIATLSARLGVVIALSAVVGIAGYVRSDTSGFTFATQGIDLKIDSRSWYNSSPVASATWSLKNLVPGSDKFFNISDVKPGDSGCTIISLHAKNTDAWMCLDFSNLTQQENGINEPESIVDQNGLGGAELAQGTEFFGWTDDGDGIYEQNERALFGTSTQSATTVLNNRTYVIGDSKGGNMCKKNEIRYVGICWCAGDLVVSPSKKKGVMRCDGSVLGNAAQTDSFSVDISLRAESVKDKPKYLCGNKPPKGNNGVGNGEDPPPPGIGNYLNDGPGTDPGNPGGNSTAPGKGGSKR